LVEAKGPGKEKISGEEKKNKSFRGFLGKGEIRVVLGIPYREIFRRNC